MPTCLFQQEATLKEDVQDLGNKWDSKYKYIDDNNAYIYGIICVFEMFTIQILTLGPYSCFFPLDLWHHFWLWNVHYQNVYIRSL
jgi:hypothetical protein